MKEKICLKNFTDANALQIDVLELKKALCCLVSVLVIIALLSLRVDISVWLIKHVVIWNTPKIIERMREGVSDYPYAKGQSNIPNADKFIMGKRELHWKQKADGNVIWCSII